MNKDKAIDALKGFPQEFELEELIEKLILVEKVEKGLQQISENKTITHEKVKEIVKKW
jgi:hypothetical protein